jgi:hypothetical protein
MHIFISIGDVIFDLVYAPKLVVERLYEDSFFITRVYSGLFDLIWVGVGGAIVGQPVGYHPGTSREE